MSRLSTDQSYQNFLGEIKETIRSAQLGAMISLNQMLIGLNWKIGKLLLQRQKQNGWGSKVLDQLAKDLKIGFPDMKGFSRRNLLYMRKFAEEYPDLSLSNDPFAQISWGHNVRLIDKCSNMDERLWYASKALEHGWSRNVMVMQIESGLYERSGKAITNFQEKLPPRQSDMAEQMMKDPFVLDFLNLREEALKGNRDNQQHITKFLLELGVGFALSAGSTTLRWVIMTCRPAFLSPEASLLRGD
ncbi:MAG: DUF1016 N-terminal domain-containing protein [Bacteroidia bacterium]